jgi:hypothetical protein
MDLPTPRGRLARLLWAKASGRQAAGDLPDGSTIQKPTLDGEIFSLYGVRGAADLWTINRTRAVRKNVLVGRNAPPCGRVAVRNTVL